MNSKGTLAIALALLMVASVATFVTLGSGTASVVPSDPTLGDYSYDVSSTGLVSNISYVSPSNSTLLVHSMYVNGSSTLNVSALGSIIATQSGLEKVAILNATMYTQGEMSTLAFVTYSNISGLVLPKLVLTPSMTFNLNNSVTQVPLGTNSTFEGPFGDYIEQNLLLKVDSNWTLFKINSGTYDGYFFTNGIVTLSNSNTTVSITGANNRISLDGTAFSILVSGFVKSEDLDSLMNEYMYMHQNYHKFTYNPGTGLVSGQYVSFTFDKNTGTITNLVSKLPSPVTIFNSISASGNGNIGTPFMLPYVQTDQVKLYGSVFYYAENTYLYGIHNNPPIQMNLLLSNGTMTFVLPAGFNATAIPHPYGNNVGANMSGFGYNALKFQQYGLGINHQIMAGNQTMLLYNNQIKAFFTVTGGSVSYNSTTHTIAVTTGGLALINFVMPPGLRDITGGNFQALQYAYQHGKIAGQYSLDYLNGTPLNYSFLYNYSLDLKFLGSSPGQVKFQASSQTHAGTNYAFFVNNTYLNSTGNVYVYVDGTQASLSSNMGSVVNSTSSSASYVVISVPGGYMVILHIANFSTHDVTISGTSLTPTALPIPLWGIIAIIVVAVVIIVVALYAMRRR